jgi:starvation-inducible outer membrane lipoprotein
VVLYRGLLIAEWRMIQPQSTRKSQMKTILMLIIGLMLAGCGSTENHVRNRDAQPASGYAFTASDAIRDTAVDAICACP